MPRVRSMTKVWPSRRSTSKTPWCAKHSSPVIVSSSVTSSLLVGGRRGRDGAEGLPGGEGVAGRAHVVHAQAPHPLVGEQRHQGGVGVLAPARGSGGAVRVRQQSAEEALAAGADQERPAQGRQ